jgi:membrane protein implicated in regulation of membrane protease activity
MFEEFATNPHWFWLSLGGILLMAEMLGASGYLLWSGVAAMIVGLLVWLIPFVWEWQALSFGVLTLVAAIGWWYWLTHRKVVGKPPRALNQRGRQLVGIKATLLEPQRNGYSRVRIGDSSWRVKSSDNLSVGEEVEVVDVDGITLQVRAITPRSANNS